MDKEPDRRLASQGSFEPTEVIEERVYLSDIVQAVWAGRLIVVLFVVVSSAVSVLYALSTPDLYRASALLAPAEEGSGGLGGLLQQQYGGLASLAGLSVSSGGLTKTQLAIAMMESRIFTSKFVEEHKLLPELLAVDHWNSETRTVVYDEALVDIKSGQWIGDEKPIESDVYAALQSAITITEDKASNLYTVSVMHRSPDIAQQMVIRLISDINETIRQKEIEEAKQSIEYLKMQAANTLLADLDQVLYELVQSQMQTMMLANVRPEYVFVTLDPAVIPEERESPNRALICIVGAFLGGVLGLFVAFLLHFLKRK